MVQSNEFFLGRTLSSKGTFTEDFDKMQGTFTEDFDKMQGTV